MNHFKKPGQVWLNILIVMIDVMSFSASTYADTRTSKQVFRWNPVTTAADNVYPCGAVAVVSDDVLLLAGGTDSSDPFAKQQTKKVWQKNVYVSKGLENQLQIGDELPAPLTFGAGVQWNNGAIVIGGRDDNKCSSGVFFLRCSREDGRVVTETMPNMPQSLAFIDAVLVNDTVYVAGGQESPDDRAAIKHFWALNLAKSDQQRKWQKLETWPGAARFSPLLTVHDGDVYLFGGFEVTDESGKTSRKYFTDAYRYVPKKGWNRLADMPESIATAACIAYGQSHMFVFSINNDKDSPGRVFAYHTITDTWAKMDELPKYFDVSDAVVWNGEVVLLGNSETSAASQYQIYQAEILKPEQHFSIVNYAALVVYLLILVFMGFYFSRREKSTNQFFLAGRRIPWWVAGISIRATQISSIGFMAMPAKTFATNWVFFISVLIIAAVCPVVAYFYLPFFRRLNLTTAYGYLEKRFNVAVRLIGSALFVLFQLGRISIVLFLPAVALSTVTGIDIYLCIIIAGALCTFYTVMGGIEAVVWTDLIQAIVLFGGIILCLVAAISGSEGGLVGFFKVSYQSQKFHMLNWDWDITANVVWVMVIGSFFMQLVIYTTDQAVVQRYLTTKNEKMAVRSIWTNVAFALPWGFICFLLGTALFTFYKSRPDLLNPAMKTDAIVPLFIAQQLPVGIAGIVIAGLFAATMSTVDSGMHSIATAVVTDFYRRFRPNASDEFCLKLAKIVAALIGIFATLTAVVMVTIDIKSLWDAFMKLVGLLTGGLGGVFAVGIFTKRTNGAGAFVGLVISAIVLYLVQNHTQIHFFLYSIIGFGSCALIAYTVSLLIPSVPKDLSGLTIYNIVDRDK